MSANQLISQKLYEIYKITDIEEILHLRTMDLSAIKNLYSKDIVMKLIFGFVTSINIDSDKIDIVNVYANEIYNLL